jgi:hypothetical protein
VGGEKSLRGVCQPIGLQRCVEYDREKRAVQLAGTVLDWWCSNGSDCTLLLTEQDRGVSGRYRMARVIFE